MPLVRLFTDFQGVETNNVYYLAGVHNVPDAVADRLVKDGRAERVKADAILDADPQFESAAPAGYYGAQAEPELRQDENIMSTKKRGRK